MLHRAADADTQATIFPDSATAGDRSAGFGLTLTTRLVIAMIVLVAVAVFAVGWLSYRSLEQTLLPRVLDRIDTHSRLAASDLQAYVRGARADVATFGE